MMIVLSLIVLLPILLVVFVWWKERNIAHIPGPPFYYITWKLLQRKQALSEVVHDLFEKYDSPVIKFWLGLRPQVSTRMPDSARKIFLYRDRFPKAPAFALNPVTKSFLGDNVVFVEGSEWAHQRKVMNPAFTNTEILMKPFTDKINECLEVIDTIAIAADAPEPTASSNQTSTYKKLDVPDLMQKLTLDVLGTTAFGFEFESLKGGMNEHLESYDIFINHMPVLATLIPKTAYLPTQANIRYRDAVRKLETLILSVIENRKKDWLERPEEMRLQQHSLLDLMILANMESENDDAYVMSDEIMKANMAAFFVAGHDTTSNALSFAFYFLASRPDVQNKLLDEIKSTLGADFGKRDATYAELASMVYLNAFLKEVLRMYPPAGAITPRITQQEEEFNGYKLPPQTRVSASIYGIHHNEKVWPDSFAFKPERFLPDAPKPHSHAWNPFGGGQRTCIGNNFSLLEQRMFLVKLLTRFEVLLDPECPTIKICPALLLKPDKLTVFMRRRTWA